MSKPNAAPQPPADPADQAIRTVLEAERDAREAVRRAQVEAGRIAEQARAEARAVAERTERRLRAVVAAFERETAQCLAAIEAEAGAAAQPPALTPAQEAALAQAVRDLAQALTAGSTAGAAPDEGAP